MYALERSKVRLRGYIKPKIHAYVRGNERYLNRRVCLVYECTISEWWLEWHKYTVSRHARASHHTATSMNSYNMRQFYLSPSDMYSLHDAHRWLFSQRRLPINQHTHENTLNDTHTVSLSKSMTFIPAASDATFPTYSRTAAITFMVAIGVSLS